VPVPFGGVSAARDVPVSFWQHRLGTGLRSEYKMGTGLVVDKIGLMAFSLRDVQRAGWRRVS